MAVWNVIDHTELSSTTVAWAEASISSSYDHLLLEGSIRSAAVANWQNLWIRVGNGGLDTGSNYSSIYLTNVNSSSLSAGRATGQTKWAYQYIHAAAAMANAYGSLRIWLPNYADTTGYKQAIIQTGLVMNTTSSSHSSLTRTAGVWHSTSAITNLEVSEPNAGMTQYSSFTLYGITA